MTVPVWVEESVVIAIHRRQLAEHGGIDGIRDKGLLESALFRPKNKFNYDNPNIFDLAAAYGYGIVKNHPFVDGNKRTSYVVMRTFLKLNGYDIQASEMEKYETWMYLASSQINEVQLADWIERKSVKI
ncbi:MAG: type II toxin-antitoxin system death-on-curing family toxin [Richelia sp. RM2_1_2]|nr:type II toxin-antitoxin system death-on-curing family toxin [Richelia sp. SM2_1_7]NJM19564.1 type II toxin-antitoxin system death-on-curing family toxin [Richelia sp. SM1_7_0]NJN07068.1 type II toxin-antitoxin system death-on-curing family toxin [Richelia sp. RM1_1_1]NJO31300.1 type II toxin-antitoxin system death-on-curing family toxin [Richelia sp. SL_2_1]NJO58473.1 type II toxin-antitoxin system death-on-curing family toxin [Richelia sp. RM2_1_2]